MANRKAPSVLIIETDYLKARLLAESLKIHVGSEQIRVARNGEQAFSEIERAAPDVIVLNMNLARPSGTEFLRLLGQGDGFNGTCIVAMTHRGQGDLQVAAKLFGASALFETPYQPADIARAVEKAQRSRDASKSR